MQPGRVKEAMSPTQSVTSGYRISEDIWKTDESEFLMEREQKHRFEKNLCSKLLWKRCKTTLVCTYFPVYKRQFFGLNFYFKNRRFLIHGSTEVFHLMYFFPEFLPKN